MYLYVQLYTIATYPDHDDCQDVLQVISISQELSYFIEKYKLDVLLNERENASNNCTTYLGFFM